MSEMKTMNLSIEGEGLVDIEERIIALANAIQERREMLAEGCACDVRGPAPTFEFPVPTRCSRAYVVCESRRARRAHGEPPPLKVDLPERDLRVRVTNPSS